MNGQRLKDARERANHTQESLAELVMIHKKNFTLYENGKSEPNSDVLARIADALNVSVDYLLNKTDDPSPSLDSSDLSPEERRIIAAFRRGEKYEAIRAIVNAG